MRSRKEIQKQIDRLISTQDPSRIEPGMHLVQVELLCDIREMCALDLIIETDMKILNVETEILDRRKTKKAKEHIFDLLQEEKKKLQEWQGKIK